MFIEQTKYDKLPLAIQVGALKLWGHKITSYESYNCPCDLYQFNDFFAEVCYGPDGQVCRIRTFSDKQRIRSLKAIASNQ